MAFETSSIVTKRKLVVTKAAGLGVEGLVLGRWSLYVTSIFQGKFKVNRVGPWDFPGKSTGVGCQNCSSKL